MEVIGFGTPAVLRNGQSRERVSHRVEVGRDIQAVHFGGVARLADNPQPLGIHYARQALEETRRPHTAGQGHNRLDHFPSPVMRRPEGFTLGRMFSEIRSAAAFSIIREFSRGPASTAPAPGSIAIISPTTAFASALSPQIMTSLSIGCSPPPTRPAAS